MISIDGTDSVASVYVLPDCDTGPDKSFSSVPSS